MAVINSSRFNVKEDIEWAMKKFLENYNGAIIEEVTEVIPEVAKEAVKKLKDQSPKGQRGKYAKGWTYKVNKGRLTTGATIYGKTGTYQLAHLLEYGHAKRGGGRTAAIVHVKPVEEWAIDEIMDRTIERLESI